jgi:SAM-dependent methyltransferase
MPTLRPDPGFADIHTARAMAESFGVDAARYDKARPSYPAGLVDRVVAGRSGLKVLDVGCGTGIAARQLQAAGCSVLGVDPDERMAAYARERGVEVEVSTFEAWQPAGRLFDVVTAAQSWHWVDPAKATPLTARVLRPHGSLVIFGHVFEPPDDIASAFAEAYRREEPDAPFTGRGRRVLEVYQAGYTKIAEEIRATGAFDDISQWRFEWTRSYTREQWLDLLPTTGGLTRLSPEKLARILDAVGAAIDDRGGTFEMEYVTLATTGVRSDG